MEELNRFSDNRTEKETNAGIGFALIDTDEGTRSALSIDKTKQDSSLPELSILDTKGSTKGSIEDSEERNKTEKQKTPEEIQMEKDLRYLKAIEECKNMSPEQAKQKLKEEFAELHNLLKGKTPEEGAEAFLKFMDENGSRLYEQAKLATKWDTLRPKDLLQKLFDQAVLGTGFLAHQATSYGVVEKHIWDRGQVHMDMGYIGALDLCTPGGRVLVKAFYGKKAGY